MPAGPLPNAYEFGPFRYDVRDKVLLRHGIVVPLKPKVSETLLLLLAGAGRVVSKDELMRSLWPDTFVEEANLSQNIYALRRALGEADADYIETVPRRGYRFAAAAREVRDGYQARSLAVLPFTPLAPAAGDAALEAGIADALVTAIGNAGILTVTPISTSLRYAGHDPVVAARDLRVDAVLDGSIQRSGDTLRVTARLIRAADGATLWAGRSHDIATDIFALQDAIAERITAALELKLGGAERARLHKRYTQSLEAYRRYLNGRYNLAKATGESLRKAIDYFEQAIAADPDYALAYVGIADAYTGLDWYGVLSTRESNPQAFAAATRALDLDPELAEAHASLALAKQYRWDWEGAEASFRRSIQLNPNVATARASFAVHLAFRGRHDEAVRQMETAHELDPMSMTIRAQQALVLFAAGRYSEAVQHARTVLEVEPANDEARVYLALSLIEVGDADAAVAALRDSALAETPDFKAMRARALGAAGRTAEGRELLGELPRLGASGYVPHFWIAAAHAALDEPDAALERLEAACDDPDDSFAGVAVVPFFGAIRTHPRFLSVLRRVGVG